MPHEKPTKIELPIDLRNEVHAEAKRDDLAPHRLCLMLINEGIYRRELKVQVPVHIGGEHGVFA